MLTFNCVFDIFSPGGGLSVSFVAFEGFRELN